MTDPDCIFCKIVRGEIPAKKVHEDERRARFPRHAAAGAGAPAGDPEARTCRRCTRRPPGHEKALGQMLALAGELARKEGAADGFRIIINTGRVGHQEVYHVHMHVLGGPEPLGPMLSAKFGSATRSG